MELSGKVVVVSGGASGLGRGTACYMVREKGARVVALDTNAAGGAELVDELGAEMCRFFETDVSDGPAVAESLAAGAGIFGAIHVCLNFAGVVSPMRILDKGGRATGCDRFRDTVLVNLVGSFNVMAHSIEWMARNEPDAGGERGAVVNIASGAAFDGQVGQSAYASSKAGVVGLALPAARELADLGIRVNTIAPGAFETPMIKSLPPGVLNRIASDFQFPKRFGTPGEIASLCAFLCENGYMNGECVRLDGAFRLPPR